VTYTRTVSSGLPTVDTFNGAFVESGAQLNFFRKGGHFRTPFLYKTFIMKQSLDLKKFIKIGPRTSALVLSP
jgi:hypothetical protein